MIVRHLLSTFAIVMALASIVRAQSPAPAAAGAAVVPAMSLAEPQGYTYDPGGRRDPFVSLMRRGSDSQRPPAGARVGGLAGLGADEITLKGTLASQGGFVGIVQGADNKTYIVHGGDRVLDGTIQMISASGMVILQRVNDPLSRQKVREVRKVLRETEEAK